MPKQKNTRPEVGEIEINQRKKKILKAVVENYVDTAEPVSSKAIAKHAHLDLSTATIRNEMSELETMGLLEQPHTSAGRVPTPHGYRIYVNELMHRQHVSESEAQIIRENLHQRIRELDDMLSQVGKLISYITNFPSYAMHTAVFEVNVHRYDLINVDPNTFIIVVLLSNKSVKNRLVTLPDTIDRSQLKKLGILVNTSFAGIPEERITIELISATERAAGDTQGIVAIIAEFTIEILAEARRQHTYVTGASSLLQHPEFRDITRARRLLDYLSNGSGLLEFPAPETSSGIKIMIGPENVAEALKDSSVVVASYGVGEDMQGLIGIVGPTRMDYSMVAARLRYIAGGLSAVLTDGIIRQFGKIVKGDEEHE